MTLLGYLSIRIKLVLLAGVPVVGALILAAIIAQDARQRAASAAALGSIDDLAHLSSQMGATVHALQAERARVALREGFGDKPQAAAITDSLPSQYRETDAVIGQLEGFLAGRDLSKLPPRLGRDLSVARAQMAKRTAFRATVARGPVPIDTILSYYGGIDDALISATAGLSQLSDDGELLRSISSLVALSELAERGSNEHALLANVFAAGQFPPGAYKTLVTLVTEQAIYTDVFRDNAADEETARYQAEQRSDSVTSALALRQQALTNTDETLDIDAHAWFRAEAERLRQLQDIESVIVGRISAAASRKMAATRASIRLGIGLSAAVVIASSLLAFLIARGVTRTIFDLSSAAARVRETKNFSIRVTKSSNDELGMLTDAFNEMLTDIKARDFELADHRQNLEGLVAARTRQLEARNESMRLVLNNVEQGLVMIGRDGTLAPERSAAFDRILGTPEGGVSFADHVARSDERARAMLNLGWEMVLEDLLPRDVAIDQLPKHIVHQGAHLTLGFTPILHDEVFDGALLVVTDVSSEVLARLEHEKQREYVAVFERVVHDRDGFVAFAAETGDLLHRLAQVGSSVPTTMALVHTIKGNAAQWGVSSVARIAHELESEIIDTSVLPTGEQKAALFGAWEAMSNRVRALVGTSEDRIEISSDELDGLISELRQGAPQGAISDHLETLKHEPTKVRFSRMVDDVERLAARLGKPSPKVIVESNGVRLPASQFGSFWASTVHVIRNLVDHGIELAADRVAAAKPEAGTITLRSLATEDLFTIELGDDGRGIEWEGIAEKARAAGLPTATKRDLELAMFASGVSTAAVVTDISGRGVGLSAVLERCEALGGSVQVTSEAGVGTRFTFTFPRGVKQPSMLPIRTPLRRAS